MKYMLVAREDITEDSWTYGDWRQYICWLKNGDSRCARISKAPANLFATGMSITLMVGFVWWLFPPSLINWPWSTALFIVSLIMWGVPVSFLLCNVVLMKAVGPVNKNGRRVLNGEV